MKLCQDCKFVERPTFGGVSNTADCMHPLSMTLRKSPVTGKEIRQFAFCGTMRLDSSPCGTDAKLFEAR